MSYREAFAANEYVQSLYEGNGITRGVNRVTKYLIDVPLSLIGLAVTSPLLLLSAVAIKLDSPGPIFYTPIRIGEDGREIRVLKFRTLREEGRDTLASHMAEGYNAPEEYEKEKEEFVTGFGRWLRRYSLDELPQLFNVLMGQMSLVGPRALHPLEVEGLPKEDYRRFCCPAGMISDWQLAGSPGGTERTALDIEYVRRYNTEFILPHDLEILIRTIPFMLSGKNR